MKFLMSLQVVEPGKRPATGLTVKGLFPGVHLGMPDHVGMSGEPKAADVAHVQSFSRVRRFVQVQFAVRHVRLVTFITLIRLPAC